MFTFQSIMFVSLGFLCALLAGFVVAPAFWARAVRLTTERIRASLPLTEMEISAERDRLRAENAIRIHQLTAEIENARLYDARQKVEINRRDGVISALERRLEEIETERKGSENARRVLEATITERVPEVETRLMEARQLLAKRDGEMKALQADTSKTYRALDEAMQLNAQQRGEIDRLKMALTGRGGRALSATAGPESETALRTELERLRSRSTEQAKLIDRLQKTTSAEAGSERSSKRDNVSPLSPDPVAANDQAKPSSAKHLTGDRARLAQKAIDQAAVIEALKAEVEELKVAPTSSSKKDKADQSELARMRSELATANERIARQASYYQNELRRLGSAGVSASSSLSDEALANKLDTSSLSADDAGQPPVPASEARPADRKLSTQERVAAKHSLTAALAEAQNDTAAANGEGADRRSLDQRLSDSDDQSASSSEPSTTEDDHLPDFDQHTAVTAPPKPEAERPKLMDRIAGLAKR